MNTPTIMALNKHEVRNSNYELLNSPTPDIREPKWEEPYKVAQVLGPRAYCFGHVEVSNVLNT